MEWTLDGTEIRDNDGNLICEFVDETFAIIIMTALSDYESLGQENKKLKNMLLEQMDSNSELSDKAIQILNVNIQEQTKVYQQFTEIIENQNKQLNELNKKWNSYEEVQKRISELQNLKNI